MGKNKKIIGLAYSDLHINIYNQDINRALLALDVIRYLSVKAKLYKVPLFFTGDLLHKEKQISNRLLSITLPFFKTVWSSSKNPTFAIDGNHDQSEENTLEHISPSYIHTFSQIYKGLKCVNNKSLTYKNLMIHGIPYLTHDLGLTKALKNRIAEIDKTKTNILLLHTTLKGAKDTDGREMESYVNTDTLALLEEFDIVLVGHIHKPMRLGKNIFQVGAPQHQRKTDRESELGYCVLYSDNTVKYVHLAGFPKFIELAPGEPFPDKRNFYYHREVVVETKLDINNNFSDTTNHTKLAKNYIKEKAIKDKKKRKALINILKNPHD